MSTQAPRDDGNQGVSGRSGADAPSGRQPTASAVPASQSGVPNAGVLSGLAERVKRATGPDRELDAAAFNAASDQVARWNRRALQLPLEKRRGRYDDGWVSVYAGKGLDDPYAEDLPRYTASIDAAMTLVPEGWSFEVRRSGTGDRGQATVWDPMCIPGRPSEVRVTGCANPALALTAACLKVRAAQGIEAATAGETRKAGLDAKPASPVAESDAPDTGRGDL
jgi:hypothetical protein